MTLRKIFQTAVFVVSVAFVNSAWTQDIEQDSRPLGPPLDKRETPTPDSAWSRRPEIPNNPHMEIPATKRRTTPAVRRVRGPYTSVQVNVDSSGDNIVGDAANEPSIAVHPTWPDYMAIGWRQFDNVASDFRQAGWAHTWDRGGAWVFPGVIDPGVFRSDPVLAVNTLGGFFYTSLTHASDGAYQVDVYLSTDGGASWDDGVIAYGGDKQWVAIDQSDSIGRNNIYINWTALGSSCEPGQLTRSYDRGATWRTCASVYGTPRWGTLAVGPDGELYIAGNGWPNPADSLVVAKSSTIRDASIPTAFDFTASVSLDGRLAAFAGPNPGGLLGQAWVAVDHSDGPTHGNVYLLASVPRESIVDYADVMFASSTNGGLTWNDPVRINDDPEGNGAYQWFGMMSVAPNGRIDVVWNDTRNATIGFDTELYYAYSSDAGQTWSDNIVLTPSFDPQVGWPGTPQQRKLGDYNDIVSDDLGANVAYAATFNGEQDVYYLRIRAPLSIGIPEIVRPPRVWHPYEPIYAVARILGAPGDYIDGTGRIHYRYHDGAFQTLPLVPLGGDLHGATLPPASCDATLEFYLSAEGTRSGVVNYPQDGAQGAFTANIGQFTTVMADDFEYGHGWTVESSANLAGGAWERGTPLNCGQGDPPIDYDGSGACYLTGNNAAANCDSDVDGGYTRLISPVLDLSERDAEVRYALWCTTSSENPRGVEPFVTWVSNDNGAGWVRVEALAPGVSTGWSVHSFRVGDFVTPTNRVRVRFEVSDPTSTSVTEAGIDAFEVRFFDCDNVLLDCNGNGVRDAFDISSGASLDCNNNATPDECEPDCDGDETPDDCESDVDNDSVPDDCDNCPQESNKDQADFDQDGAGDACDSCPADPAKTEPGVCGCGTPDSLSDADGDGVIDCLDNCPGTPNADQADSDGNNVGDACEPPPAGIPTWPCAVCGEGAAAALVPCTILGMWLRRRQTRHQGEK